MSGGPVFPLCNLKRNGAKKQCNLYYSHMHSKNKTVIIKYAITKASCYDNQSDCAYNCKSSLFQ